MFGLALDAYKELETLIEIESKFLIKSDVTWEEDAQRVRDSARNFLAEIGVNPDNPESQLIDDAKNMFPLKTSKIDRALMGKDIDGQSLKENQISAVRSDQEECKETIAYWATDMGEEPEALMETFRKHPEELKANRAECKR